MAARDELIAHLDDLLEVRSFEDYGPNGLQVPGSADVGLVASGVSAHAELFRLAAEAGAQLVICHHGMLWDSQPRAITPAMKRRLELLFAADMSLAAYHLPLDAHPELGNNALICAALGFRRAEPFASHRGRSIGFVARSDAGVPFEELHERCSSAFGQEPFAWDSGPRLVRSVGVVSGGGASSLAEAAQLGLDALLTGEPAEYAMADAREAGIHFIAAGHYATETFGIRALGDRLAERFGVEHRFIDVPNPI
ncbi:MAG TPA: Nif3-like dinuclear metal center hexameric protein [Thermoleophilaceae bacterium]|nr:Nif3-like dinuclear metal center hexameric protein [Thermoleophilaceae bacterium]